MKISCRINVSCKGVCAPRKSNGCLSPFIFRSNPRQTAFFIATLVQVLGTQHLLLTQSKEFYQLSYTCTEKKCLISPKEEKWKINSGNELISTRFRDFLSVKQTKIFFSVRTERSCMRSCCLTPVKCFHSN
jgi:hypothetical protein